MSGVRHEIGGVLGAAAVNALMVTTRLRRLDEERYVRFRREGRPVIFAFWHGHLLPLLHAHRGEGIVTLVSDHGDGEYLTRVNGRLGYGTVRGSSTRGGVRGLKGLIRAARSGRDLALTPDGPRGPARRVKPGALAVAQATGLPIVPLAAGASGGWHLGSWDAFLVPRPFSTVCVAYGEPVRVERDLTRDGLEALAREVGRSLDVLAACARKEALS